MDFVKPFDDPRFRPLWDRLNHERIFLMHNFFNTFPLPLNGVALSEASQRLAQIDKLLDVGWRLLTITRDKSFAEFKVTPEFLKAVIEHRRKPTSPSNKLLVDPI